MSHDAGNSERGASCSQDKLALTAAALNGLIYFQTLQEFQALKIPGQYSVFGPPFRESEFDVSNAVIKPYLSPFLTLMMHRFLFTDTLPAVRDAPPGFWSGSVQPVFERLALANLSDSFDKGAISKRKVLGLACVSFLVTISRGLLFKVPQADDKEAAVNETYDFNDASSLQRGWERFKRNAVYEGAIDRVVELYTKSDTLDEWPNDLYVAHLHVCMTLASLLHFVFVSAADSKGTLGLVERVHSRLPWFAIRQALKVGNVSNMIAAVTKIFLAKPPVWGRQSLLQSIMSSILSSDRDKMNKSVNALLSGRNSGSKAQRDCIDVYVYDSSRERQTRIRETSQRDQVSIVQAIFADEGMDGSWAAGPDAENVHSNLLQYLSLKLSIRDREELMKALCSNDDLNHVVRQLVDIFYPIIHEVHRSVNLSAGAYDLQNFLDDLLATLKSGKRSAHDMLQLVLRHHTSYLRLVHQLCKNSPKLREEYSQWYQHCLRQYRAPSAVLDTVDKAIQSLDEGTRKKIYMEAQTIADYRKNTKNISLKRQQDLLSNDHSHEDLGMGEWLCLLQDMYGAESVTPSKLTRAVNPDSQPVSFADTNPSARLTTNLNLFNLSAIRNSLLPAWLTLIRENNNTLA